MDKQVKVALFIIVIARILQIFWDWNYDWPDEHWQGTEIAYKLANGYGSETWEWTIQHPIRSILYQGYLSIGYFIANFFHFQPINQERMVKIMQVLPTILCDWFLIKIALVFTKKISFTTTLVILSNWFYFSMMNRTYINSIETSLAMVAYYFWLIRANGKKYDLVSRILVGANFIIRTTSIILWVVIWPLELFTLKSNKLKFIAKNILQIVLMLLASIGINSYWNQQFTFVQLNFFNYNIIQQWSNFYGVHSYLYYFYFAVPFILGGYLLFFIVSLFLVFKRKGEQLKNLKKQVDETKDQIEQFTESQKFKELFWIILAVLVLLSFTAHKEPRFLLIISPVLLIASLKGIKYFEDKRLLLFLFIVINLSFLSVMGLYGKNGGVRILRQLRDDIDKNHFNQQLKNIGVIYLCEPHSLPSYSIIQKNISLKIIDTSPLRKLQGFKEQVELKDNPITLYQQLKEELENKQIIYLIIQDKYAIFNGRLRDQYQFLLKNGFSLLKSKRNVNLWEQYLNGYDAFTLLKKT